MPSKVALTLFAYLYVYKSKFSKTYRGTHIDIISEKDDQFEILNTSTKNPDDFDFRGQLIRMELPLVTYHNNIVFEIYFEKLLPKKGKKKTKNTGYKAEDNVLIKGSVMDRAQSDDDLVRIKITNFAKFISMNMENNNDKTKSLIIELKQSEIVRASKDNDDAVSVGSDYGTDSDFDETDPRYVGLEAGDPFVSGEYYFIGIISNKVETFDTDTDDYHLDGYGIDSATDYVYVGEGNNVVDTEELNEPWSKPSILNLDKVKVVCDMSKKTLTFYKNGTKFGPKDKDYTMSFDHYGVNNKQWYPAVCIVNKNVKAVFKYCQ
eukprot:245247_1